jgi:hypothetical protein
VLKVVHALDHRGMLPDFEPWHVVLRGRR